MKNINKNNKFEDPDYVEKYGKSALARIDYTNTMANDIKIETKKYNIKNVKKILDIGCGIGDLDLCLLKEFPDSKIIGIDSSREMLRYAEEIVNNKNVSFINSTIENYDNESEWFDLIVTQYSFCFWNYAKAIPNIIRMLKKGGLIYFRNINPQVNEDIFRKFLQDNCSNDEERQDFAQYLRSAKTVEDCKKIVEEHSGLEAHINFFRSNSKYNDDKMKDFVKDKIINYNIILQKL